MPKLLQPKFFIIRYADILFCMIYRYSVSLLLLALCGIPKDFGSLAMLRMYWECVLLRMSQLKAQLCGRGNVGGFGEQHFSREITYWL